ncbi:MAG: hypothetical protein P8074_25990 [Anaerolineales bacterium]
MLPCKLKGNLWLTSNGVLATRRVRESWWLVWPPFKRVQQDPGEIAPASRTQAAPSALREGLASIYDQDAETSLGLE